MFIENYPHSDNEFTSIQSPNPHKRQKTTNTTSSTTFPARNADSPEILAMIKNTDAFSQQLVNDMETPSRISVTQADKDSKSSKHIAENQGSETEPLIGKQVHFI